MNAAFELDPVLTLALRACMALLFASAGLHKLGDPIAFRSVLSDYRLLPDSLVTPAAWAAGTGELLLALAFLVPAAGMLPALAATALLTLYSCAIAVNLLRGRHDLDCGCGGPPQRLHPGLVARNLVLVAASLLACAPTSARTLGWLDGLSFLGTVACATLLWAASNRLMALVPATGEKS